MSEERAEPLEAAATAWDHICSIPWSVRSPAHLRAQTALGNDFSYLFNSSLTIMKDQT